MTNNTDHPAGFAAAVSPVASTVVHTPQDAIIAGETSIPSQGENMPAYHARPRAADGPLPVVIVVQEIFGVHEHIRDICRRLALEGYMAVAPELYFRQGDPNEYDDISSLLSNLVSKVPDAQVLADLDHVASWASRNGGDAHRLMLTGFCWGGRIAWLYAAHNPQLKAAVAWYGKLLGDKTLNSPKHPVDVATDLTAPVLGLYGAQDTGISLESVETMRQALRAPMQRRKLSFTRTRAMRLTPIIARVITRRRQRMVGSACWSGSTPTVVRKDKKRPGNRAFFIAAYFWWVRYAPYKATNHTIPFSSGCDGCAARTHPTNHKPHRTVFCELRWVRCAYPPYKITNLITPFSAGCGGCATLTHPTKP